MGFVDFNTYHVMYIKKNIIFANANSHMNLENNILNNIPDRDKIGGLRDCLPPFLSFVGFFNL